MNQTKNIKKDIINFIKCNYRDVSVKHEYCTYSEAYWIKVYYPMDNDKIKALRDVLRKYECIDRDARTGEVLEGGNTYIFLESM